MQIDYIQPEGVAPSPYYANAISVSGGKTLYVAGQTAYDENREYHITDFAAQVDRALHNLNITLKAGNANPQNVVMIHVYIKNYSEKEHLAILAPKLKAFFGPKMPASTLLGVQALARDSILFEIEAIAIVP